LEKNIHFADRKVWHAIKPEKMQTKREAWQKYLSEELPKIHISDFEMKGRGIVYTASGTTLARALTSAQLIRHHGCQLPIEIWYLSGELSQKQIDQVENLGFMPMDILTEQKKSPHFADFRVGHAYGMSRNYHIKTMVLLMTKFKESTFFIMFFK
jgi:hypothetical protein